jgi:hypothetical protein
MLDTPSNEVKESLVLTKRQDLRSELIQHMESFASENKLEFRDLLKDISKKQNISLRGLEKIVSAQVSTPAVETQIKIYSYIYKTESLVELLTKVPEIVASNIQSAYTGTKTQNSGEILKLSKDRMFNSIYLLTAGDLGISLSLIREEFGRQGLKMVESMIKLELVTMDQEEIVKRKNAILMSPEIRKNMLAFVANDLYQPEKNQNVGANYSGLILGDVTEEEYEMIYHDLRAFMNSLRERVFNSRPTADNFKKIAIGSIMDEYNCSTTSAENKLC